MKQPIKQYDVFISHASKDKLSYVDKLAQAIKNEGLEMFYDADSIEWGDNISEKIETALSNCLLAVVVISKHYFGRQWTEHEIRTLLKRQSEEHEKLVMPILYGVTKKQLVSHYPELNDIQFKYSKNCKCDEMASILKKEIEKRKNNRV